MYFFFRCDATGPVDQTSIFTGRGEAAVNKLEYLLDVLLILHQRLATVRDDAKVSHRIRRETLCCPRRILSMATEMNIKLPRGVFVARGAVSWLKINNK